MNAPLVPSSTADFDLLKYWQSSSTTHPTLGRMAKDILAVPITSVASESAFSMGSRTLTKYRASLLPKNVEALVCTQNWLFGYSKEEEVDSDFEVVKENLPEDVDHECLSSVCLSIFFLLLCFFSYLVCLILFFLTLKED